jgi:hypothetical protein
MHYILGIQKIQFFVLAKILQLPKNWRVQENH